MNAITEVLTTLSPSFTTSVTSLILSLSPLLLEVPVLVVVVVVVVSKLFVVTIALPLFLDVDPVWTVLLVVVALDPVHVVFQVPHLTGPKPVCGS